MNDSNKFWENVVIKCGPTAGERWHRWWIRPWMRSVNQRIPRAALLSSSKGLPSLAPSDFAAPYFKFPNNDSEDSNMAGREWDFAPKNSDAIQLERMNIRDKSFLHEHRKFLRIERRKLMFAVMLVATSWKIEELYKTKNPESLENGKRISYLLYQFGAFKYACSSHLYLSKLSIRTSCSVKRWTGSEALIFFWNWRYHERRRLHGKRDAIKEGNQPLHVPQRSDQSLTE